MERCDAACHIPVAGLFESGCADHIGKALLIRESADALDEVLVRGAVIRNHLAQPRDHIERIGVIDLIKSGDSRRAEFQT